jgi:hypothetical protein
MNVIIRNMEKHLQEKMSDSDDETASDINTVTMAQGRARCQWSGFRPGMMQWRMWHGILGTSVVNNRRRGQVAESHMVMAVMWKRRLLGKRWQVIKAGVQDRQELEDMQCIGTAAARMLKITQKRRKGEEKKHERENEEQNETRGVASVLEHQEEKGSKKILRGKSQKKRTRKSRARAASSRLIRESVQDRFDEELRDAVYSLAPVRRVLRAAPRAQVCGITEEDESRDTNSCIRVASSKCVRGARRRVYKPRVQKAGEEQVKEGAAAAIIMALGMIAAAVPVVWGAAALPSVMGEAALQIAAGAACTVI